MHYRAEISITISQKLVSRHSKTLLFSIISPRLSSSRVTQESRHWEMQNVRPSPEIHTVCSSSESSTISMLEEHCSKTHSSCCVPASSRSLSLWHAEERSAKQTHACSGYFTCLGIRQNSLGFCWVKTLLPANSISVWAFLQKTVFECCIHYVPLIGTVPTKSRDYQPWVTIH